VRLAAVLVLCAGCASGPRPDPAACAAPADRVEVEQVQFGWNRVDYENRPPVVDVQRPSRDVRQTESLAEELLAQCRKGVPMAPLQDKFSEVPGGSQVLGPNSDVDYKAAALCLQPGECVVVRGKVAFHLLKRVR